MMSCCCRASRIGQKLLGFTLIRASTGASGCVRDSEIAGVSTFFGNHFGDFHTGFEVTAAGEGNQFGGNVRMAAEARDHRDILGPGHQGRSVWVGGQSQGALGFLVSHECKGFARVAL